MNLRRDIHREIFTGEIRITGQCHMDDGAGVHTGWEVKTWSDPTSTAVHLPTEFHWVILNQRKVVRWAPSRDASGHPPQDAEEDPALMHQPERKAFILASVDEWERTRYTTSP
jgi:hypothetical protein